MVSVGILAKDASSTDRRFHGILLLRYGSNQCDSCEQLSYPKINSKAAQEASSEFIFHCSDCSKLSHWFKLILNHA